MRKIVKFVLVGAFAFLVTSPVLADSPEGRLEAAKLYAKTVSISKMMNDMLDALKNNPQLALTDQQAEAIRSTYDYAQLEQLMIEKMVVHFTEEELRLLADFYGRPEGQSIMKKMPAYLNDYMPFIQQKTFEAVQKVKMQEAAK